MTTPSSAIPDSSAEAPAQWNSLASASMATGILSIFVPLLVPIALIQAALALRQIRTSAQRGRGMAIAGITCSGVGMVTGAFLGIVLYQAYIISQQRVSLINLQTIGQHLQRYTIDNRGWLPPDLATLAMSRPTPDTIDPRLFVRPGSADIPGEVEGASPNLWASKLSPGSGYCSYTYVPVRPIKIHQIRKGSEYILIYETAPLSGRPVSVLCADGHAEAIPAALWPAKLAALQAGQNPPP